MGKWSNLPYISAQSGLLIIAKPEHKDSEWVPFIQPKLTSGITCSDINTVSQDEIETVQVSSSCSQMKSAKQERWGKIKRDGQATG